MSLQENAGSGDKSLRKLLELLERISNSREGIKGRQLAEASGNSVSTTFRMLKLLTDEGYLLNRDGFYILGPSAVRLGYRAQEQNPLQKIVHPYLVQLSDQTKETVHLAGLRGTEVYYFDKMEGHRSVRMASLIGNTAPVYCTGVGKAIIAFLPQKKRAELLSQINYIAFTPQTITTAEALEKELDVIRSQGYALDDCEHETGVYCLAAPILDSQGYPVAGISISGAELYLRREQENLSRLIRDTAMKISHAYEVFSGKIH